MDLREVIARRCRDLGMTRGALAACLGYRNPAKALRRLDAFAATGEPAGPGDDIGERLRRVLAITHEEFAAACEGSREAAARARACAQADEERRFRETFVPHAIIVTEKRRPSQIAIAALIGAERFLRIDLDHDRPRTSYAGQALSALRQRYGPGHLQVPFFGRALAVVINFTPDRAVEFDLDGRARAILAGAMRPGRTVVTVRRR